MSLKEKFLEITAKFPKFSGLKYNEAWKIFQDAISKLVVLAEETLTELSGPEKKAQVLQNLNDFYDRVIGPIDLPYVPNLIEPYLDKFIKKSFLALADGAIDSLVETFNNLKIFK